MPFNSIAFVAFFLFITILFYSFRNTNGRTLVLLGGSYFFYGYLNIFNLVFLITTTVITFFIASRLNQSNQSKILFYLGCTLILMQLILTKYSTTAFSHFSTFRFIENQYFNFIVLPIGISFYSLQAIGLLVDVQKGKYQGDISLRSISQFLSFFPQSMAGPIHRADELIPQFSNLKVFDPKNIIIGFKITLWGYFCKLMIADKLSLVINPILGLYYENDGFSISIATLLYSFQIYFDFWAYSLIAIGVGRILGFTIEINFANPYSARSFRDFWHRWHITLSKWMRDYIYIPLGGSRQRNYTYFCLAIIATFVISGFWHGATYNFILWGAVHAFLYLGEDSISGLLSIKRSMIFSRLLRILWTIYFFSLISLTWLIFRTDNILDLMEMYKSIFSFSSWNASAAMNYYFSSTNLIYLMIILTTVLVAHTKIISRFTNTIPVSGKDVIVSSIFVCICLVTIILWGDIGGQEFLYFRF